MGGNPWYADEEWSLGVRPDGSGLFSVPHPTRAGLAIDPNRTLELRSAALGYAVFAYADEKHATFGLGEYRIPVRLFVLWRLQLVSVPLALELVLEDGEWVCQQLVVVRPPKHPPITQTLLRKIAFKDLIFVIAPRAADRLQQKQGGGLTRMTAVLTQDGSAGFRSAAGVAAAPGRRGKRLEGAFLEQVASVYREAVALGRRDPTIAVAERFPAARSTAGRWIVECRKRGLLGPASPGRRGERRAP